MKLADFYHLIQNPQLMQADSLPALQEIVQEYPFCEAAWMLMLKNLHNTGSIKYENELRRSSAYVSGRSALYALIHNTTESDIAESHIQATRTAHKPAITTCPLPAADTQDYFANVSDQLPSFTTATADYFGEQETEETLPATGRGSFAQWLSYIEKQPRASEPHSGSHSTDLIDNFLSGHDTLPRRKTPARIVEENALREEQSQSENDGILTETLARIYLEQHQYEKAINIFKKLCLKNPEKSIYFAARISEIEKLNEK